MKSRSVSSKLLITMKKCYIPQLDKDCYERRVYDRVVDLMKLTERLLQPKRKYSDMVADKVAVLKHLLKMPRLNVPEIQELHGIVRDVAFFSDPTMIVNMNSSSVEMFSPEFMKEAERAYVELIATINNHDFFFRMLRQAQENCVASAKELFSISLMLELARIEFRGAVRIQAPGITEKRMLISELLMKQRAWTHRHADDVENYTELYKEEEEIRQEVEKIALIIEEAVCARIQQKISETLRHVKHNVQPSIIERIDVSRLSHGIYRATSETYEVSEPPHPSKASYSPCDSKDMPVAIPNEEFTQIVFFY